MSDVHTDRRVVSFPIASQSVNEQWHDQEGWWSESENFLRDAPKRKTFLE